MNTAAVVTFAILILVNSNDGNSIRRTLFLQNGSQKSTQSTPASNSFPPLMAVLGVIFASIFMIIIVCLICHCCYNNKDNLLHQDSKYKELEHSKSSYVCNNPRPYGSNENRLLRGPSGLKNTSETCYMNSMLQAVASSNTLIEEYEELVKICDKYRECPKLKAFVKLLNNINTAGGGQTAMQANTDQLKELMKEANWKLQSQQDSFHLLSAVINAIQRDIKDILDKENITMPPKYKMLHSFTEDVANNKVQDHLALALPLCGNFREIPGVVLNFLLDAFLMSSKIEDSSNETQVFFFQQAPKVLIIHIQANEWSPQKGAYVKPSYFIRYHERMRHVFSIQMARNCSETKVVEVEYALSAVVHHIGGVSGGHYIAYRKFNGEWYLTNDEQVQRSTFSNDVIPYIMVYEMISQVTK